MTKRPTKTKKLEDPSPPSTMTTEQKKELSERMDLAMSTSLDPDLNPESWSIPDATFLIK